MSKNVVIDHINCDPFLPGYLQFCKSGSVFAEIALRSIFQYENDTKHFKRRKRWLG
jgi:hypothetical protein